MPPEFEVPAGLSVVIPARNEERGLDVTLSELRSVERSLGIPVETIVVDDGSSDATASVARAAGARVLSHPISAGYGRALKTGVRAASHEWIAICDADGTYPLTELPALLERCGPFDMVVGARTGPNLRRRRWRSPVFSIFLLLTNFVTGKWIPDPNSGLRIFRRSQIFPLLDQLPNGFSFTTTSTLILTLSGKFVYYHPIDYRDRIGTSKVRFLLDALRAGQGMLEVTLRHNPLKAFLAFALLPASLFLLAFAVDGFSPFAGWMAATSILVFALGMLAVVVGSGRRD